jgi:aspartate/methionine/tyrosine aminotransferase
MALLTTLQTIDLGVGDPTDAVPDALRWEHANWILDPRASHYPHPHGERRLSQAIVRYYQREHGIRLNPSTDVCVTHGARPALFLSLLALGRLGGPVGYLSPAYVAFEPIIEKARMTPVSIPIEAWVKREIDLRGLFLGLRGGVFLLNNPHNPTGMVLSPTELYEVTKWSRAFDVRILSDDVYAELYDHERPESMLRYDPRALEVISISKTFRACGWRVGAVVGEASWVENFKDYYGETNGVSFAAQMTAASALGEMIDVGEFRAEVKARRTVMVDGLRKLGFLVDTTRENRSGLFVWALIPPRILSSSAALAALLGEAGVKVSPGSAFGRDGEGAIRFSLNVEIPVLYEALSRIGKAISR